MPEQTPPSVLKWMLRSAIGVAVVWIVIWVMGYTVSMTMAFTAVACLTLVLWLAASVVADDEAPDWPDPTPVAARQWFGLDLQVRRISNSIESAGLPDSSGPLRHTLRELTADRLVARGADPDDPFADADLPKELVRAIDPTTTKPLNRRALRSVLRRIEEL